jgi:MarR family transcriptional regulator, organic hydroperoxide resistance regulator
MFQFPLLIFHVVHILTILIALQYVEKERNEPSANEQRLGFMIYRAGLAIARGYERVLSPIKVVPVESGVLGSLCYRGPNHVRGLARQLGVGRQTIVNVTKSLESKGWISRALSANDARLVMFSISQSGRKKMQSIEAISTEFDTRLSEIVGKSNEHKMIQLLRDIVSSPFLGHQD